MVFRCESCEAPGHRPGLPGKIILFHIAPFPPVGKDPACRGASQAPSGHVCCIQALPCTTTVQGSAFMRKASIQMFPKIDKWGTVKTDSLEERKHITGIPAHSSMDVPDSPSFKKCKKFLG
jgi:hypothetical protein